MIKLIDLLKETKIGSGEHGEVYNVDKDKVIKKSNNGFSDDEMFFYKKFNEYPELFPKIYKLTKEYIIMERLDTDINQGKVLDFLESIGVWVDDDPLNQIYSGVKRNNFKEINDVLSTSPKEINNILKDWLNFCKRLNNLYPEKYIDVKIGNVGKDKNNNIKIFDLSLSL